MVTNRIIFTATALLPNPDEVDYWIDLNENPYGGCIKYFNGTEWVELSATSGLPDLSNYYTQQLVNALLNTKASVSEVNDKVDKEEAKDLINGVQFNTSMPNDPTLVVIKYDGSSEAITLPVASISTAGIVTAQDFLDFVKQHLLLELHTEMIDLFADIRAKYQKRLIAGNNIYINPETNVISATGDVSIEWDQITNKPDIDKLFEDVNADITALNTDLANEVTRSTNQDTAHTTAINTEVSDRKLAITDEVTARDAAIKVETDRAKAAEEALGTRIDNHTNETNSALDLKADKSNTYTKEQVDAKVSSVYKVKGSVTFANLPTNNTVGDVYNVTDDFTLNSKPYDAGTNVVWTETGWDALSGSFDTSAIEDSITTVSSNLAQEITDRTAGDNVLNTRLTTAEGKLNVVLGDNTTAGSINKALADAKLYADDKVRRGTVNSNVASEVLIDESENIDVLIYTKDEVDLKFKDFTVDDYDADIASLRNDLNTVTTQVNTNKADILTNTLNITNVSDDLTDLTARVSANETRINTFGTSITANTNNINNLDTRVSTNTNDITNLTQKVNDSLSGITGNNTDITNLTNTVNALDTRVSTNETNISTNTESINTLETDTSNLKLTTSNNTASINSLRAGLTTAQLDVNNLETSVSTNTNKINSKVRVGTEATNTVSDILIDTANSVNVEVYTKAEVDSIIAKLKADNNLK